MWNSCHSNDRNDSDSGCDDRGYERRDDCDPGRHDDHGYNRHYGWGSDWRGNDCNDSGNGGGEYGHHGQDHHGLIVICH
jgi:hypothetical protein